MERAAPAPGRVAFVLKGYPRLSETFIAQEILALEAARARHPDRVAAPPDRSQDASGASGDPRPSTLSAGISVPGAGPGLARLAAGAAASGLSPRVAGVARRSAPRPDPEPDPAVWPGAGADGRVTRRRAASSCSLPAHAGLGRALCSADPRSRLDRVGARQGHLDDPRLGKARKARRGALGGDLHRGRPCPSGGAGAPAAAGGVVLSRARPRPLFAAAGPTAERRRQRSRTPGRAALGRPGGAEKGL